MTLGVSAGGGESSPAWLHGCAEDHCRVTNPKGRARERVDNSSLQHIILLTDLFNVCSVLKIGGYP